MKAEEWRTVSGWPYEVSSYGHVRRASAASGTSAGRIVQPSVTPGRYPVVTLSCGRLQRRVHVHVLVCETFHGARPAGRQVRHLDGDKTNNAASNVSWGSAKENAEDKRAHGTLLTGDRHPRTRIAEADYRKILAAWDDWPKGYGKTARFIDAMRARFGVTKSLVEDAIYGRVRATRVRSEATSEERRAL